MCYIIFLSIFLILFSVLAWRRLDWAVMLIIAGLPLYLVRFKVWSIPMTLLEAMILIAFFCWIIFKTKFWDFLRGKYKIKDFLKNSPWNKKGSAEGRRRYPFGIEIILLLIISFAAVGVAHFSATSLGLWKAYFFEPILLYILILNIFQESPLLSKEGFGGGYSGVNKIGLSLAVGALIVSSYAIFQKFTGFGIDNPLWAAETTRRVVSFFGYPNAVGLYLGPVIPVLTAFLFLPPKKDFSPLEKKIHYPLPEEKISAISLSKGFLGFIIVLSLAAVYFAKSDGALIGLAVAAFIFCLFINKKARIAVLAVVVIAAIGIYFYPPIAKPLERKITIEDFSGQVRRLQWKETLMMLNGEKKIWGIGLGNFQQAVAPYHQPGFFYDDGTDPLFHQHTVESAAVRARTWQPVEIYLYPHNIILNFWVELGLAGLFLFVWIFGKTIYLLSSIVYHFKAKKDKTSLFLALGLLSAIIVIIVHGLVDVPYFKNDLSCIFWILVAILVLLDLRNKDKRIEC
ncbi:MAG: O-antigen ligase family protein [Patescibacteria group bacterium]|nr:O-antigen ligase family protein [Patescibacteria group bacterium]